MRSKFLTANDGSTSITKLSSKSRTLPYAFTEQGIYMLMTVLKGALAVDQSKALIRTFKGMKDFIVENRYLFQIFRSFSKRLAVSFTIGTSFSITTPKTNGYSIVGHRQKTLETK